MFRTAGIASVTVLVIAASASAKGVSSASVCGADGCREIEDTEIVGAALEGAGPAGAPEQVPEWYRVTMRVDAGDAHDRFSVAIVPARRLLKGPDGGPWMRIPAASARELAKLARGLEPLPESELEGYAPLPPPVEPASAPEGGSDGGDGVPSWLFAVAALGLLGLSLAALRRRPRLGT
jgi:hypothetical protein